MESVDMLVHQPVDLGDKYLGVGGFIAYGNGSIVGMELSPATKQPFFNLTQDGSFYFFGSRGRGPGEFLMPFSIQSLDNQTVGVLDAQTKVYSELAIPNEGETPIVKKEVNIQSPLSRVIKTAFDQYVALLSLDEKMFSLVDSTGVQVGTFFEYPYRDAAERQNQSRSMAYQGTLSANPSKTKFVYSSFFGEIIHFYSIEENNIKNIAKIENEYPLYQDSSNGNSRGVSYDPKGEIGYIATCATDRFVYAIYSGRTALEWSEKKRGIYEGQMLHVFDWNGVLVKRYELDVPCGFLCVSDDDAKMWAIATNDNGETVLASFDLDNPMKGRAHSEAVSKQQTPGVTSFSGGGLPAGVMKFGLDVRTKDNQHNEETKKVLDSLLNLPPGVTLDLRSNDRYDARVDTIDNVRTTVLILK
jgi:hypothetical protein